MSFIKLPHVSLSHCLTVFPCGCDYKAANCLYVSTKSLAGPCQDESCSMFCDTSARHHAWSPLYLSNALSSAESKEPLSTPSNVNPLPLSPARRFLRVPSYAAQQANNQARPKWHIGKQ